jgi:hypothetical protein
MIFSIAQVLTTGEVDMSRFTLGTAGIAAVFLAGTFGTPASVQAQESDAVSSVLTISN